MVDGACIFLNRPDFPGGAGCALHGLASRRACTRRDQAGRVLAAADPAAVPRGRAAPTARRTPRSASASTTARGWGPGGHDLDWYCSGNTEAHVGVEPVYLSNEAELIELMGQPAYDVLAGRCEAHVRSRSALALHPADPAAAAMT